MQNNKKVMESARACKFRIYPGCGDCTNANESYTVYGWEDVTAQL